MTQKPLSTVTVVHGDQPNACVIWLHGLGADAHDFESIVSELYLPTTLGIRFIFPNAPMQPVTINGGTVMRAWYDISAIDMRNNEDEQGILASEASINLLIEEQIESGITPNRIILAGFSQGGAIALYTGLKYRHALAGILALSAYLPLAADYHQYTEGVNSGIAILMAHGTEDGVVPIEFAEKSKHLLQSIGYKIAWHTFPIEHTVCLDEIKLIGEWLQSILQPANN